MEGARGKPTPSLDGHAITMPERPHRRIEIASADDRIDVHGVDTDQRHGQRDLARTASTPQPSPTSSAMVESGDEPLSTHSPPARTNVAIKSETNSQNNSPAQARVELNLVEASVGVEADPAISPRVPPPRASNWSAIEDIPRGDGQCRPWPQSGTFRHNRSDWAAPRNNSSGSQYGRGQWNGPSHSVPQSAPAPRHDPAPLYPPTPSFSQGIPGTLAPQHVPTAQTTNWQMMFAEEATRNLRLQSRIRRLEGRVRQREDEIDALDRRVWRLEGEREEQEERIWRREDERDELGRRVERLEYEKEELERGLWRLEGDHQDLDAEHERLSISNMEKDEAITKFKVLAASLRIP